MAKSEIKKTRARHHIQQILTFEIREICISVTLICSFSSSRIGCMGGSSNQNQDHHRNIAACGLAMHPINLKGLNTMNWH
jgi:hypothetical protein